MGRRPQDRPRHRAGHRVRPQQAARHPARPRGRAAPTRGLPARARRCRGARPRRVRGPAPLAEAAGHVPQRAPPGHGVGAGLLPPRGAALLRAPRCRSEHLLHRGQRDGEDRGPGPPGPRPRLRGVDARRDGRRLLSALRRVRVAVVGAARPQRRQIGRPAPSAPPWTPRPAGDSFRPSPPGSSP